QEQLVERVGVHEVAAQDGHAALVHLPRQRLAADHRGGTLNHHVALDGEVEGVLVTVVVAEANLAAEEPVGGGREAHRKGGRGGRGQGSAAEARYQAEASRHGDGRAQGQGGVAEVADGELTGQGDLARGAEVDHAGVVGDVGRSVQHLD